MPVQFNPDTLGDKDVQAILSMIDSKLEIFADFIKGDALNTGNLEKQRAIVEDAKKALGVHELKTDWRLVVAKAAITAGCLKVLMELDPDYLRATVVATRFPVEAVVVMMEGAMTAKLGGAHG